MRKPVYKSERTSRIRINPIGRQDLSTSGDAGGYANAELCLNADCSRGDVRVGAGVAAYFDGSAVNAVKYYFYKRVDDITGEADDRLLFYAADGYIYEFVSGTPRKLTDLYYTSVPVGVCYNYNGEDVMIFSSPDGQMKIYNGRYIIPVADAPRVTSMTIHYERLFITGGDNDALWFSDDFDPTNWNLSVSEAGFIDLSDGRGEMLKAVSFADYLYVFRTYGITRVTAFSEQEDFKATGLYVSSGKIFADSITICGDCILFLASDGLYRFDGYSAVRISSAFRDVLDRSDESAVGAYYDGRAYFTVSIFVDGASEKVLLSIDPKTGDYYFIRGIAPTDLCLINGAEYKLLVHSAAAGCPCSIEGKDFLGEPISVVWKSKTTDFGIPVKRKRLDGIAFFTKSDATVTVSADGNTKKFSVKGGGVARVRPMMRGDRFSLRFESEGGEVEISDILLTLKYYL